MAFPPAGSSTSGKSSIYNNTLNNNTICINTIRTNIDYDAVFVGSIDQKLVDNIVDVMVEVLCSNMKYISINGNDISVDIVKSSFLKVKMFHIQYVVNVLRNYDKQISNPKGFIISTLYNSVMTLDAHYTNLVNL